MMYYFRCVEEKGGLRGKGKGENRKWKEKSREEKSGAEVGGLWVSLRFTAELKAN